MSAPWACPLCGLGLTAAGFLQLDSSLSLMLGARCLLGVGFVLARNQR